MKDELSRQDEQDMFQDEQESLQGDCWTSRIGSTSRKGCRKRIYAYCMCKI